jgi:transposase
MKLDFSPDQFDLETATKTQVADVVQALLEKLNQATTEIQSKDEKIQALTFELAYLRRIRYGTKSEAFSQ